MKKYIALESDIFEPYDSAWEICMITRHYKEAFEFLDEGAKKLPELHWAHLLKGFTYLLMGDAERARSEFLLHYSEGEKTAYDEFILRRNFGLSYLCEGKLETGYVEFENAFNVAKREKWFGYMSMILQNLGKILVYQGRYEEAVAAFERAEKISWDRGVGMSYPPGHFVLFCKLQKGGETYAKRSQRGIQDQIQMDSS